MILLLQLMVCSTFKHCLSDSDAHLEAELDPATVPTFQPLAAPTPQSETLLLLQLDCFGGPGLSEEQFIALIVRCHVCRKYMTRGTIEYHHCQGGEDK